MRLTMKLERHLPTIGVRLYNCAMPYEWLIAALEKGVQCRAKVLSLQE